MLKKKFNEEDIVKLALKNEKEMKKAIGKAWLELLKKSLQSVPPGSNIFVEIAFGLQADKLMFRFTG